MSVKLGVTAGEPHWDKDKACGKALFHLINIRPQTRAPPTQALVTSGAPRADVADPSRPFNHICFYANILRSETGLCSSSNTRS